MIKPLTSLRFIFALVVLLSHLYFIRDSAGGLFKSLYDNVLAEGFIGVSFFFILSGFVLSYSYSEKVLNNKLSFKKFWIARFARIYPVHILTMLLAIPLSWRAAGELFWWFKMSLHVFMIHSFTPSDGYYFTFNPVSWSLSDEMFFYFCFPFLLFILSIKKYRISIPIIYTVSIIVGVLLVREVFHHALFYVNPLMRIADFIIGMLIYRLYTTTKYSRWFSNRKSAHITEILSILLLSIFLYFHNDVPLGYRYSIYYWLPMSLVVYTFSFSKGFISDILSNKTLVYLGEISFGIYMFHILVFRYYYLLHINYEGIELDLTAVGIISLISLLLAMLSYKYYEAPMNKYVKNKVPNIIRGKLQSMRKASLKQIITSHND